MSTDSYNEFSEQDADDALRLSSEAACIVLESGGETYRSEEIMKALSTSLGAMSPESYATPTGFMASCDDAYGKSHAMVKRIQNSSMNLEKINRTTTLTRNAVAGLVTKDEVELELCNIDMIGGYPFPIPDFAACMATSFFCLLFGGAFWDAVVAGCTGILLFRIMSWFSSMRVSVFFCNIIGGLFDASVVAIFSSFGIITNPDATIIGVLMLLVPGVTIVNSIRDMIAGDLVAGVARIADAFISAAGISVGVTAALELVKLIPGVQL